MPQDAPSRERSPAPATPAGAGARTGRVALACSALTLAAVALVAATPGSGLQPVLPPGARPAGPVAGLADVVGLDALHGGALAWAGVVAVAAAAGAFLLLLRAAWRGELSVGAIVALALVAHVVVLSLPLLFSRDVYSYAIYGRIAGIYGHNPYVATPADVRGDAIFGYVGPKWASTTAVYGPAFTLLSAGIARGVRSIPSLILTFRAIAVVASLATFGLIGWLAGRLRPRRRPFALAMWGLNPVVLFQSVASGHNDVLVALAIAGALALLVAKADLVANTAVTLGALVKMTAALPLSLLVIASVRHRRDRRSRWRALAAHVGVAVGISLAFAVPFLQTSDPTLGAAELAGHEGWLAPSRLLHRIADWIGGAVGIEAVATVLSVLVRVAFAGTLVVCVVLLARELWQADAGPAQQGATWGWALLLLMLLGPVLLPWYVTWVLPLAFLLPRVPRTVLIATSTALTASQFAAEPERFPGAYDANLLVGHYVITPLVVGMLAWLLLDLRRRLRAGSAPWDERERVPASGGQQHDDGRAERSGR